MKSLSSVVFTSDVKPCIYRQDEKNSSNLGLLGGKGESCVQTE